MNPDLRFTQERKDRWVADLRSGKFKQGKNVLLSYDPFGNTLNRCLGVYGNQLVEDGLAEWKDNELVIPGISGPYTISLPSNIISFDQNILIDKNDARQESFEQIADYIEAAIRAR